ncbi:flavin reductase [Micromonospora sp. 4G55]|uniref:flavin reductase n=1 Tax=Micromonospora sp. 4G55 TaxID=2806102 RepID=UPI001EE4DACF|nr:flavin reductase [Micromonospora sp. 4G55]
MPRLRARLALPEPPAILLDEYRQQSTNLRVYLATCLTSATQELAANPADLRDRFLGWVPHRVPS